MVRALNLRGGIFLIKNNLKSFLIHVSISIISVLVFMIFFAAQPCWVSEEAAKNHHISMMFLSIAMIIVATFSYYLLGRKYLISQGSKYKDLFSVSLIAILGALLWANAFIVDGFGPSNVLMNSGLWEFYSMYNGYSLFFIDESGSNNPYIFLLFSFIPTIAMWTGILKKST